jgi:hypothetical protein
MNMDPGDDAIYLVRGVSSISFQIPLGDVLELNNVTFVFGLKKNLLLISYVANLHYMTEFDVEEVILGRQTQVVAKGVRTICLYRV